MFFRFEDLYDVETGKICVEPQHEAFIRCYLEGRYKPLELFDAPSEDKE